MSIPSASVVMAINNEPLAWIEQALNSIRAQTFEDFECLLMCDGPALVEVRAYLESVQAADSRFLLHELPKGGLTAALIHGVDLSRGDVIFRHDADDWSVPTRFEQQYRTLDANPAFAMVGSNYFATDEAGTPIFASRLPCRHAGIVQSLRLGNVFCHGSLAFRRGAYCAAGGYRREFAVAQDYDLVCRISEQGAVSILEPALYYFRRRGNSVSARRTIEQEKFCEAARVLARQRQRAEPENLPAALAAAEGYVARSSVRAAALARSGDYALIGGALRQALAHYWGAIVTQPARAESYLKMMRAIAYQVVPRAIKGKLFRP